MLTLSVGLVLSDCVYIYKPALLALICLAGLLFTRFYIVFVQSPGQVMQSDLDSLGYVLEYGGVDSKNYLLPQRRNRIYATADVGHGQCADEYGKKMKKTMDALASEFRIPVDTILQPDLPQEALTTERQETLLRDAVNRAAYQHHGRHVFIDGSTSTTRAPEFAVDLLTCVRPTHGIYSEKLRRWVTVNEMCAAQGLWDINFANPEAVQAMLANTKDAQDLAGNAFSPTTMQARVIASIIHSTGWESVGHVQMESSGIPGVVVSDLDVLSKATSDEGLPSASPTSKPSSTSLKRSVSSMSDCNGDFQKGSSLEVTTPPATTKRRRYVGKCKPRNAHEELPVCPAVCIGQPNLSGADCKQHVEALRAAHNKRAASKQPDGEPAKKRKYTTNGKVARDGKRGVISIYRKVELLKALGF